jgi:two-component system response regulator YesN
MAVNRLREIPASFEAASHAFAHRYLVGDSCVLDSAELEKGVYMEKEEFNIKDVDPKQLDRGKIREFLKFGDRDETIYFVEEFFKAIGANVMKSNIFRQYITMDIYFCVAEFVEGLQVKKEDAELPDAGIFVVQSEENAVKYTVALIDRALEIRETAADNKYGSIVDKMIEYIGENYADDELSLNLIASHINFSPNHLSTIFARQTGQTFIKYLTEYRMNKAKELLRCTGKRSSEISVEVGYKDSHYFSYLFKKTQGMTPTQYRGQKSPDGEE